MSSVADWESEARDVEPELVDGELDSRLSVLRDFTVADHLDDRSREAVAEFRNNVI